MLGLTAIEFFIASVVVFMLLYWCFPKKLAWIPFLVLVFLFAVLAFHITPAPTDDLSGYFHRMNMMREYGEDGLEYALNENWYEWQTYRVAAYYFYFCTLLPSNNYLPAITMFIVYGLLFLVLYRAAIKFNVSRLYLFLGSMFTIATYWYYDTASGIRNGLAFVIAFACTYYHLVERKNILLCCVGYVCAALTHSAGIMPVVLAILAEITVKLSGKFVNLVLLTGVTGGGVLLELLSRVTNNRFILAVAQKAEDYTERYTEFELNNTMFMVSLATTVFVAFVFLYFYEYISKGRYAQYLKRFYRYVSILLFFLIGSVMSALVFVRFARWIIPVVGALCFMIGGQLQSEAIQKDSKYIYRIDAEWKEVIRLKVRPILMLAFLVYTAVHFWYLCVGSSLVWIHF